MPPEEAEVVATPPLAEALAEAPPVYEDAKAPVPNFSSYQA